MQSKVFSWKESIDFDDVCERLLKSKITNIQPLSKKLGDLKWIEHNQSVFHVSLSCGLEAVFRPGTNSLNNRFFDSTVFAYQLSRELQLDVIPPAVMRAININLVDSEKLISGTLQYFISPEIWSIERQTYEKFQNLAKVSEIHKVILFQYIAGISDRHRANQILDDAGNLVIVDVGDICLPKMIVEGRWEFFYVGSLSKASPLDFSKSFESQNIVRFENPSKNDLKRILRPFIFETRLEEQAAQYHRRLLAFNKKENWVDVVIWNDSLWVSIPKNNYRPLSLEPLSNKLISSVAGIELTDSLLSLTPKKAFLLRQIIQNRLDTLMSKGQSTHKNSFEYFDCLYKAKEKIDITNEQLKAMKSENTILKEDKQKKKNRVGLIQEQMRETVTTLTTKIEMQRTDINNKIKFYNELKAEFDCLQTRTVQLEKENESLIFGLENERQRNNSIKYQFKNLCETLMRRALKSK